MTKEHWLIRRLYEVFTLHNNDLCMVVEEKSYTYADITRRIAAIQHVVKKATSNSLIGIAAVDSPDTYAAILACWFLGRGYVPVHPRYPVERNLKNIEETGIDLVISPTQNWKKFMPVIDSLTVICSDTLEDVTEPPVLQNISDENVSCVLFTSGSTGQPKAIPLSLKNLACTFDSFLALGYDLTKNDRFLQMYEFTFDQSIMSFLPTFYFGASMYTVSFDKIRYLEALKIMQQYTVTFTILVPSTIALLRPFFSKISLPDVKYNYLGGEALPLELAEAWSKCVPNALITNVYAPSEATMLCMGYELRRHPEKNHSHNGIVPFGEPWKNTTAIVINENLEMVGEGITGEICFAGDHVMTGYLNQPEANKKALFEKEVNGQLRTFYRSGDMVFLKEGIYYTCGRVDLQVKIEGHKVELEEIEFLARKILETPDVYALTGLTTKGTHEIYLVVKATDFSEDVLREKLNQHLAPYMMPSKIKRINQLIYNNNGKVDRKALKSLFQ